MSAKVIKLKEREREPSELEIAIGDAIETLQGELDVVCFIMQSLEQRRYENAREAALRKAAFDFMNGHGHRLIDLRSKLYAVEKLAK